MKPCSGGGFGQGRTGIPRPPCWLKVRLKRGHLYLRRRPDSGTMTWRSADIQRRQIADINRYSAEDRYSCSYIWACPDHQPWADSSRNAHRHLWSFDASEGNAVECWPPMQPYPIWFLSIHPVIVCLPPETLLTVSDEIQYDFLCRQNMRSLPVSSHLSYIFSSLYLYSEWPASGSFSGYAHSVLSRFPEDGISVSQIPGVADVVAVVITTAFMESLIS